MGIEVLTRRRAKLTLEERDAFAEEMQAINWNDPVERNAIALKIVKYVEDDKEKDDIVGLFANIIQFNVGETLEFTTVKGLKAYVHEPGTWAPRSTVSQRYQTLATEQISANVGFDLTALKGGRYGTMADFRSMAVEELLGRKYAMTWTTMIGSVPAANGIALGYFAGAKTATVLGKLMALNSGLDYVEDQKGGVAAIIGRRTAFNFLNDSTASASGGFSSVTRTNIENFGGLSAYRGHPIVKLNQYQDGYGVDRITDDEIMILAPNTLYIGENFGLEVYDKIEPENREWVVTMTEMYGAGLIFPERNARIALS